MDRASTARVNCAILLDDDFLPDYYVSAPASSTTPGAQTSRIREGSFCLSADPVRTEQ
jgi:hypothetical protein